MEAPIADQELVSGVAGTVEFTYLDGSGSPAAAGSTPTLGIVRADGTTLVAAGSASTVDSSSVGRYTYALTAAQTGAQLDRLTVTWKVGSVTVATTIVDVVGRWPFSIREARASHPWLESEGDYPDATVSYFRRVALVEAEWICDRAFVPRFDRVTIDGSGERELLVGRWDLRSVLSASVDDTALTAGELADLVLYERRIEQPSGSVWSSGQRNVVISFTYGLERPPADLLWAMLLRLRDLTNQGTKGIPARATQASSEGISVALARASEFETGNPDVDAVYHRYSKRTNPKTGSGDGGARPRPYSRALDMNPQYGSLFHGGRR